MMSFSRLLSHVYRPESEPGAGVSTCVTPDFPDDEFQVVADETRLEVFMRDLCDRHVQVQAWLHGLSEWHQATVTSLDPLGKQLSLSIGTAVCPSGAEIGGRVNLAFQRAGAVALCCLEAEDAEAHNFGHACSIRLKWPRWVMLHEMRSFPRLRLEACHRQCSSLTAFLGIRRIGLITDISEGGLGLCLNEQQLAQTEGGSEFLLSDIEPALDESVSVRLSRTYLMPLGIDSYHVGARFVGMSERRCRELRKILYRLQIASAKALR